MLNLYIHPQNLSLTSFVLFPKPTRQSINSINSIWSVNLPLSPVSSIPAGSPVGAEGVGLLPRLGDPVGESLSTSSSDSDSNHL